MKLLDVFKRKKDGDTLKHVASKAYGTGYKSGFKQGQAFERTKGKAKWRDDERYVKVRMK